MFFKRLSGTDLFGKNLAVISPHQRVSRWTKRVQLFRKKLVFVPICQIKQWYLIVLVSPNLM